MSINIVTEPGTGAPITAADYNAQNTLISANQVPMLSILTDWESTTTAPLLKQNSYIRYAGNTYQVQTADEAISGSPAAGINYIALTLSGTVLTAAWVTVTTGYSFNPAYGGIYNSDATPKMLLMDICYLDGTLYYRGMSPGTDHNSYVLSNGKYTTSGGMYISGEETHVGYEKHSGSEVHSGGEIHNGEAIFFNDINMYEKLLPRRGFDEIHTNIVAAGNYFTLPTGVWLISSYSNCMYSYVGTSSNSSLAFSDGTARVYNNNANNTMTLYWRRVG